MKMSDEEKRSKTQVEEAAIDTPDHAIEAAAPGVEAVAHGGGHHGPHISSRMMLIGVAGALLVLTVLTVGATAVDLGSQVNFIIAMVIATLKAALVMLFFMHLAWDKKFNVVVFTSSFLFVMLFLAMALLDRQEYQNLIDTYQFDKAADAS
jgi:cytochrome c oxidase subunit 4